MPTKPRRQPNEFGKSTSVMADIPEVLRLLERCKRRCVEGLQAQVLVPMRKRPISWSRCRNPAGILRHKINVNGGRSWTPKSLACAEKRVHTGKGRLSRERADAPPIFYGAKVVQISWEAGGSKLPARDDDTLYGHNSELKRSGGYVVLRCKPTLYGAETSRTGQNGGGSGGTKPTGGG
ncbi:hypothetical protein C8R44DRAFT_754804 [Mycena epipterygia]|nr:hypothetical protein C8R44DRAFT_754804 [Mycena epipterygia]